MQDFKCVNLCVCPFRLFPYYMQQMWAASFTVIIQTPKSKIKQVLMFFSPLDRNMEFLLNWELPKTFSVFPSAFRDRSTAEIKPLTESPLAVNCSDRIRFNTALDFLSPPRKVRNECLAFLCHLFVSLEIKSELDRYCVVKGRIKGSVLVATAVLENSAEGEQGVRFCGALSCHFRWYSTADVMITRWALWTPWGAFLYIFI